MNVLKAVAAVALLASGCGDAVPTAPLPSPSPSPFDTKAFVEALFLGSGPMSDPSNRGCINADRMAGWLQGTPMRIRLSPRLSEDERAGIVGPASQITEATQGAVRVSVEVAAEPDPMPGFSELTASPFAAADIAVLCNNPRASLCVITAVRNYELVSVRIVGTSGNQGGGYSHEFGHGIGLCHLNPASPAYLNPERRRPSSIMGAASAGRRFTQDDLEAIRSVYAAGLRAGATRAQFVEAGLIHP